MYGIKSLINVQKMMKQEEVKKHMKRKWMLEENNCKLYTLLWSKSTESMKAKMKSVNGYQTMEDDQDGILLLQNMEKVTHKYEDQRYSMESYTNAQRKLYNIIQGESSNAEYYERFNNIIKSIESYGIEIGNDSALLKEDEDWEEIYINSKGATIEEIQRVYTLYESIKIKTKDKLLGYLFIKNACKPRFGKLVQNLENEYSRGYHDSFPSSMESAYEMLINYREYTQKAKKESLAMDAGVAFTQGKYYNVNPKHVHLTCNCCKKKGHITPDCPDKDPNYYNRNRNRQPYNNSNNNTTNTNATSNHEAGDWNFYFTNIDDIIASVYLDLDFATKGVDTDFPYFGCLAVQPGAKQA